jgi:hypothetical protein
MFNMHKAMGSISSTHTHKEEGEGEKEEKKIGLYAKESPAFHVSSSTPCPGRPAGTWTQKNLFLFCVLQREMLVSKTRASNTA